MDYVCTMDWGWFPVGDWLWGFLRAFRFLGEHFEAPFGGFACGVPM